MMSKWLFLTCVLTLYSESTGALSDNHQCTEAMACLVPMKLFPLFDNAAYFRFDELQKVCMLKASTESCIDRSLKKPCNDAKSMNEIKELLADMNVVCSDHFKNVILSGSSNACYYDQSLINRTVSDYKSCRTTLTTGLNKPGVDICSIYNDYSSCTASVIYNSCGAKLGALEKSRVETKMSTFVQGIPGCVLNAKIQEYKFPGLMEKDNRRCHEMLGCVDIVKRFPLFNSAAYVRTGDIDKICVVKKDIAQCVFETFVYPCNNNQLLLEAASYMGDLYKLCSPDFKQVLQKHSRNPCYFDHILISKTVSEYDICKTNYDIALNKPTQKICNVTNDYASCSATVIYINCGSELGSLEKSRMQEKLQHLVSLTPDCIINATIMSTLPKAATQTESPRNEDSSDGSMFGCTCRGTSCRCCCSFLVPYLNKMYPACIDINFLYKELALEITISVNGENLYNKRFDADSILADFLCVNIPYTKSLAELCLKFRNLNYSLTEVDGCIDAEVNALFYTVTSFQIGCFNLKPNIG
nr:hypothetical protein BgiMline_012456 [Biomphalaria glabrata]